MIIHPRFQVGDRVRVLPQSSLDIDTEAEVLEVEVVYRVANDDGGWGVHGEDRLALISRPCRHPNRFKNDSKDPFATYPYCPDCGEKL